MVEIPLNLRNFVFKGVRQRTVTRKIGRGNQHVRRKSRSQPVNKAGSLIILDSRLNKRNAWNGGGQRDGGPPRTTVADELFNCVVIPERSHSPRNTRLR